MASASVTTAPQAEEVLLRALVDRVEQAAPRRESTTEGELRAQQVLAESFAARGLALKWQPFRYSRNLYAVIALHYAVAVAGSTLLFWQPLAAAFLHLLAAVSYLLDCHYRGFWLRRLVGFRNSQNLLATVPAEGTPRRRIVLIAHADAAPTGWMFNPWFLKIVHSRFPNSLCWLRKQMLLSIISLLVLAIFDVTYSFTGWWRPGLYVGLTLGSAIPLVLLLQIVVTNRTVPGINDNFSGCIALVALADRLKQHPLPSDVEVVFVVSGCEESGRGGAWALASAMQDRWDRASTTVIALDTLSGGQLRYHVEGEILPIWPSPKLINQLEATANSEPRFHELAPYHAPAGATDAAPLLLRGYDSVCITQIDRDTDLPRNYHTPQDDREHLNYRDVQTSIDFTERLLWVIAETT